MSAVSVTRSYVGRAEEPIAWEALLHIFDALFGRDARSLPRYPEALGEVTAQWWNVSGARHEAEHLDQIQPAYENHETVQIEISSWGTGQPDVSLRYLPAQAAVSVIVTADSEETAESLIEAVRRKFPLTARYVFVSYTTADLSLARYVAEVLEARLDPSVSVFVAKRDIPAGANPMKVMLEEQLPRAEALLAVFTKKSLNNHWVWWESSAVWARGGLTIPLFADVGPSQVGEPITLVCQGRKLFDQADFEEALKATLDRVSPCRPYQPLTAEEAAQLSSLGAAYGGSE